MRGKKIVVFILFLAAFLSVASFAETKKWTRAGVNPFARVRGNLSTPQVMKAVAEKYSADIKVGFDQVGMSDLSMAFLDQLASGTFVDKTIPIGDKFSWVFFRVGNKVKVWEDVVWAGKKPLEAFSFTVNKNDKNYEFIIPKPCGNIALYKVTEAKVPAPLAVCKMTVAPLKVNVNDPVTVDVSGTQNAVSVEVNVTTPEGAKVASHSFAPGETKWQVRLDKPGDYDFRISAKNADSVACADPGAQRVHVNSPPNCKLFTSCLPCKDWVGKPVTIDASGSTDVDGQVVKASFEITDAAGNVIDTYTAGQKPLVWQKTFAKPGTYGVNVVVYDDMGASSSPKDPCKLSLEVTNKKMFFVAQAGPLLARGTYTMYAFGQVGLMWNLVFDTLDLMVLVGGAAPFRSGWNAVFLGDILLDFHLGRAAYVDAGVGYSTKEKDDAVHPRKSGFDLVGAFGVNIFDHYTSRGSVFAEIRVPALTSGRTFDEHYKLLLGFRIIF